ncbi:shikimate dehydrogenase [Candidatus Uhrbacteria bacterium]|nr:shikimate dehydrogenase [Candidatus Uhrbacteria bacterium]
MNITTKTKLNAVIGYPLAHSMSPLLHTTSYASAGIDAIMLAFPHPDVSALVQAIRTLGIGLTAVTIPHKESIIPYLDGLDDSAREVGAVNTVISENSMLRGYNTDVIGVEHALRGIDIAGKNTLILGAGGAARAVAVTLSKKKAAQYYWNRTPQKAQILAQQFGGTVLKTIEDVYKQPLDIIVNTTPIGMHPDSSASPLPGYHFEQYQKVMDCVYNPLETALLKQARLAGAQTISGIEMFIAQGVEQIRLWSGIGVDPQEWREVLSSWPRPTAKAGQAGSDRILAKPE